MRASFVAAILALIVFPFMWLLQRVFPTVPLETQQFWMTVAVIAIVGLLIGANLCKARRPPSAQDIIGLAFGGLFVIFLAYIVMGLPYLVYREFFGHPMRTFTPYGLRGWSLFGFAYLAYFVGAILGIVYSLARFRA